MYISLQEKWETQVNEQALAAEKLVKALSEELENLQNELESSKCTHNKALVWHPRSMLRLPL